MAHSSDNEGAGSKARHVLSEQAFALYGEPILDLSESGTLSGLNQVADAFLKSISNDVRQQIIDIAQPALANGRPMIDQIEVDGSADSQTIQVTALPLQDGGVSIILRDVTLETSLRLALVDSRQRYKDFVEISADFSWETQSDRSFSFVSPRGGLGFTASELVALDPASLVKDLASGGHNPFFAERRLENNEAWLQRADGRSACVVISAMPLRNADGEWRGARGVCRDVTESREREATLARVRNRERILTRIVRSFRDEVNPENMLKAAAETLARGLGAECCQIFRLAEAESNVVAQSDHTAFKPAGMFGTPEGDLHLPILDSLAHGAGAAEVSKDNWQVLAAPARYQGALNGAAILWRHIDRGAWNDDDRLLIGDIANQIGITIEQLIHHERMVRISRTDAMTGLLNRGAFMEALSRQLHRMGRDPDDAALMYVDLDNFKAVNDTRGHQAGDEVLLKLRDILIRQTRPTDLVSRLGGDEFAVFLAGADMDIAKRRAEKFLAVSKELRALSASPDLPLGMSVGIAVLERDNSEPLDDLLARADAAMYEAKKSGKGRFAVAPPPSRQVAS